MPCRFFQFPRPIPGRDQDVLAGLVQVYATDFILNVNSGMKITKMIFDINI